MILFFKRGDNARKMNGFREWPHERAKFRATHGGHVRTIWTRHLFVYAARHAYKMARAYGAKTVR